MIKIQIQTRKIEEKFIFSKINKKGIANWTIKNGQT
jgi:hypothetical protein